MSNMQGVNILSIVGWLSTIQSVHSIVRGSTVRLPTVEY